jgi:hypothetical protein
MSECSKGCMFRLTSRHSVNCGRRNAPAPMPDKGHVEITFPASETTSDPKRPRRHPVEIRDLPVRRWGSPLDQFRIEETLINQDGTLSCRKDGD